MSEHAQKPSFAQALLSLQPQEKTLALSACVLAPERLSQMLPSELDLLIDQLLHVGEKLGVDTMPISDDADQSHDVLCLQKNESWAGPCKWWLVWSLQDLGWHQIPRKFDLGCMVYTTCKLMCRFVLNPEPPPLSGLDVRGSSVLEFGTGIGMLGVFAAIHARQVIITDGSLQAVQIAAANARLNGEGRVQADHLTWGREQAKAIRQKYGRFDRLLGSDIVYSAGDAVAVFECVDELLSLEPGATFVIGIVERTAECHDSLMSSIEAAAQLCGFVEVSEPLDLIQVVHGASIIPALPAGDISFYAHQFVRGVFCDKVR